MRSFRNETELSRAVIERVRDVYGGHARKVHQSAVSGAGEPDIDACVRGRCVKVELKMPGGEPTAEQYGRMHAWARSGALVGWVTSLDGLDDLLRHLDDAGWSNPQLDREHRGAARSSRRRSAAAVREYATQQEQDPLAW